MFGEEQQDTKEQYKKEVKGKFGLKGKLPAGFLYITLHIMPPVHPSFFFFFFWSYDFCFHLCSSCFQERESKKARHTMFAHDFSKNLFRFFCPLWSSCECLLLLVNIGSDICTCDVNVFEICYMSCKSSEIESERWDLHSPPSGQPFCVAWSLWWDEFLVWDLLNHKIPFFWGIDGLLGAPGRAEDREKPWDFTASLNSCSDLQWCAHRLPKRAW